MYATVQIASAMEAPCHPTFTGNCPTIKYETSFYVIRHGSQILRVKFPSNKKTCTV